MSVMPFAIRTEEGVEVVVVVVVSGDEEEEEGEASSNKLMRGNCCVREWQACHTASDVASARLAAASDQAPRMLELVQPLDVRGRALRRLLQLRGGAFATSLPELVQPMDLR